MEKIDGKDYLSELKKEMSYKWRVQSFSKNKPSATCVAYIDSRDVQDRLDYVFGIEGWQSDYKEIKGNLYAGIGVFINGNWVWKWDCGTESNQDAQKGEASDSFKRAAVKLGIGRFLYSLKIRYITANEKKTGSNYPYCVDNNGKRIYDLTKHINGGSKPVNEANPHLKEGTKEWSNCVKALKDGFTLDQISKKYTLTGETKAKLISEVEL